MPVFSKLTVSAEPTYIVRKGAPDIIETTFTILVDGMQYQQRRPYTVDHMLSYYDRAFDDVKEIMRKDVIGMAKRLKDERKCGGRRKEN